MDVYKTVKRIHDGTDQMKIVTQAAASMGGITRWRCFARYWTVWSINVQRRLRLDGRSDWRVSTFTLPATVTRRWSMPDGMIDRPATATVTRAS